MSKRRHTFAATACAFALAANSLAVFAQDKTPQRTAEPPRERTLTIEPAATPSAFGVRVPDPTFVAGAPALAQTLPDDGLTYAYTQSSGATAGFMAAEAGFDTKLVKGVPFSAEQVTEFNQPLADGNRIARRSATMIYRDGQGRTRREANSAPLPLIEFNEAQNLPKTVIINDPVEGATYVLEPRERVARRSRVGFARTALPTLAQRMEIESRAATTAATAESAPKQIRVSGGVLQGSALKKVNPAYPVAAKAARASGAVQVQITVNEKGEVIEASIVSGHPLLRDASLEAARQWQFKPTELGGAPVKVQGVLTFNFTLGDEANKEPNEVWLPAKRPATTLHIQHNRESLGKQLIEGVECEGTRIVQTIPAGQIGNERPLEIITERWYSPELQVTVLSKQSDPRYGETVVRLANILRVEPDEHLFRVPAEYTIKDDIGFRVMEEKIRRQEER
jgi:TonB family protein